MLPLQERANGRRGDAAGEMVVQCWCGSTQAQGQAQAQRPVTPMMYGEAGERRAAREMASRQ